MCVCVCGMATMKENKRKGVVGDKIKEEVSQSCPSVSSTMKVVPHASSKRKKMVSKRMDTGNLPSPRGNKKQKVDLPTKSIAVVVLNYPAPVTKSRADTSSTRPSVNASKPSRIAPMTLLESEDLGWEKFNQAVTDKDIAICYDMSMKEFEHSTVHDLFKVL